MIFPKIYDSKLSFVCINIVHLTEVVPVFESKSVFESILKYFFGNILWITIRDYRADNTPPEFALYFAQQRAQDLALWTNSPFPWILSIYRSALCCIGWLLIFMVFARDHITKAFFEWHETLSYRPITSEEKGCEKIILVRHAAKQRSVI